MLETPSKSVPEGYRAHLTIEHGTDWPNLEAYLAQVRALYGPILAVVLKETHTTYCIPERQ